MPDLPAIVDRPTVNELEKFLISLTLHSLSCFGNSL
jgi:hypothetical protein